MGTTDVLPLCRLHLVRETFTDDSSKEMSRRRYKSEQIVHLLREAEIKLGGGQAYRRMKPLFVGFIIGEFMGLALSFIVGLIYHSVTGKSPVIPDFVLGG